MPREGRSEGGCRRPLKGPRWLHLKTSAAPPREEFMGRHESPPAPLMQRLGRVAFIFIVLAVAVGFVPALAVVLHPVHSTDPRPTARLMRNPLW